MEVQTDATDVKDVCSQKKQANGNAQKQKNRTVAIKSAAKVLSVKNIFVPLHSQIRNGTLADRLGNGLQNRVEQFDSARYLQRQGHGFKACVLFAFKQYACPYCFFVVCLSFLCRFVEKY